MKGDNQSVFWWNFSQEKVLAFLGVNPEKGLSAAQVKKQRDVYGANAFIEIKPISIGALVIEGLQEPVMLLLLAIAVFPLVLGKIGEAMVMIVAIAVYILVELINEYRADRTMLKLKALATPTTKVIRDGGIVEIATADVVVGDILVLDEGVLVPADARILAAYDIVVNEASLTGEALPVKKNATVMVPADTPLAERINCVFSATTIVSGQGTAVVFAVGKKSVFGEIAQQAQETQKEKTVLQESMARLARVLTIFAVCVSILIPVIGYMRGLSLQEMILNWFLLAFLMIPEQPPILITMALALAAFVLAKKDVIVKRLRGIEIMGQVTAIISDKTGTITESVMAFEHFFTVDGEVKNLSHDMHEKIVLALPDHCTDPTDKVVFDALKSTKKNYKQIGFSGFSNKKPWRDLVYEKDGVLLHAIAGSPELLLEQSTCSAEQKKHLEQLIRKQAGLGKRLTAYAYIENNQQQLSDLQGLQFVAVAVMADPVRHGVKDAIATLERASVNTFIVTGDHQATAQAIAAEVGIAGEVVTGSQLEKMTDQELLVKLQRSNIFARMDPAQKLRLVNVLQHEGEIVAVIGDGINDAPALKAAQVGIAMGQIGTDLAKEVSDLILTDDNYVHIPDAIATGRTALDNFKKGLTYYLATKAALLIIFLLLVLLGMPFPFSPIEIILLDVLMDLASTTIFISEEAEPDIMRRPAQRMKSFLKGTLALRVMQYALPLVVGMMVVYLSAYNYYGIFTAQTAAFVTWLLMHVLLALNLKQEKKPLTIQGIFTNYFGLFWLCAMIALSLVITTVPLLFAYFATTWLPLTVWVQIVVVACASTCWIEVVKLMRFKRV